jgi:hypothetical protein
MFFFGPILDRGFAARRLHILPLLHSLRGKRTKANANVRSLLSLYSVPGAPPPANGVNIHTYYTLDKTRDFDSLFAWDS